MRHAYERAHVACPAPDFEACMAARREFYVTPQGKMVEYDVLPNPAIATYDTGLHASGFGRDAQGCPAPLWVNVPIGKPAREPVIRSLGHCRDASGNIVRVWEMDMVA